MKIYIADVSPNPCYVALALEMQTMNFGKYTKGYAEITQKQELLPKKSSELAFFGPPADGRSDNGAEMRKMLKVP